MDTFNILSLHQTGFRSRHSCTTSLLKVTDDFFTAIDQNYLCLLVLLDYSKVFGRIKHQLLLAILRYIGFTENAMSLMENNLIHCLQCVTLRSPESEFPIIENGVSQGSILGPLIVTG